MQELQYICIWEHAIYRFNFLFNLGIFVFTCYFSFFKFNLYQAHFVVLEHVCEMNKAIIVIIKIIILIDYAI